METRGHGDPSPRLPVSPRPASASASPQLRRTKFEPLELKVLTYLCFF